MALVNPNIAMSFRQPEIQAPNALAQYAQIQQIMSGQQAQDLARYQLGAAQRAESTQNALSEAYAQSIDSATGKIDYNKLTGLVAARGAGAQLPAIQKTRSEAETAQLAADKTKLEIQAAKRKFGDELRRGLSANPSDANIIAFGEDAVLQGLYTPEQVKTTVSQLLALSPADRVRVLAQSGASASELKPTFTPQTLGGTVQVLQTPAFGGQATVVPGSTGTVTQTPAQIAQDKRDQQRLALEGQRVNLEGQRVEIARQDSARKDQGLEALPRKEIQKREAAFPQATSVIKGFETKSDSFVKDLEKLRDHPGLSQITGLIAGRVPALTADGRAAQALYDKVVAKGGFQALQDLRDASKTGGALGNVSNQEGKQLTASFAAIDRRQDAKDVQAAIDDAIGSVQGAKTRMREAYDSTYSYKQPATAAAPAAGANVVVTPDGQTHTFPTPAAAAQFKKAAGL
jgi:hypothetical protein